MLHPGFFENMGPFPAAQLARATQSELAAGADGARAIADVRALSDAGAGDVSFLDNRKYLPQLEQTAAGFVFVQPVFAPRVPQITTRNYTNTVIVAATVVASTRGTAAQPATARPARQDERKAAARLHQYAAGGSPARRLRRRQRFEGPGLTAQLPQALEAHGELGDRAASDWLDRDGVGREHVDGNAG